MHEDTELGIDALMVLMKEDIIANLKEINDDKEPFLYSITPSRDTTDPNEFLGLRDSSLLFEFRFPKSMTVEQCKNNFPA